jgi:hemerythrin superfamily protein
MPGMPLSRESVQGEDAMTQDEHATGPETMPQPHDAIAMLQADHLQVHTLFRQYEETHDPYLKQIIAEHVFAELEVHAQLEEQVFYPAYETNTGKNGTQLAADSHLAHEHVKELLIEMRDLDLAADEFETKFQELMHTVQHHVDAEENEMFPEAEQILADQLDDLRDQMRDLKQQLTTTPRP